MKSVLRLSMLLAGLALASCAPFTLVEDKPVTVGAFTVQPQMAWSSGRTNQSHIDMWTVDGLALNSLVFFSGIGNGEPLMDLPNASKDGTRTYSSTMLPDEVAEFVGYYLTHTGSRELKLGTLQPVHLGAQQGFRFDATYVTESGLKMKAMATFAQPNGKLDLMLFYAPEEYYFGHMAAPVEKLFETATVNG